MKNKNILFYYITAVPKSTRFSTRLKTPAKTKIAKRQWKNLLLTSIPKSTQLKRSTTLEKLCKTKAKVSTVFTQDSELFQRPANLQTSIKKSRSTEAESTAQKALLEDLDLIALLKAGRALEHSETRAKEVESDKTMVNVIKHNKNKNSTQ